MKKLIDISTKKLELLKNNCKTREILELDIAFNKAYNDFLKDNQIESLEALDYNVYRKQLKDLKNIVTEIYSLESENIKPKSKSEYKKNGVRSKKITNLYKKNMK